MPIYMDRHDLSETVPAESVALIHQEDLKIQDQFGCRGLTYWFDDKRKTAFCLIEAPDAKAIHDMHNSAHGQVPHAVIEVDARIVESFLGRIEDPVKAQNTALNIINDPAFRIVMVILLPFNPTLTQQTAILESTSQSFHHTIVNRLPVFKGELVKQAGNYFLVSFAAVSPAVQAARDIQARYQDWCKDLNSDKMGLKIALSAGAPVTEKKTLFEDSIKLAERMCKIVKGELLIASTVKELYNSENPEPLREGGSLILLTPANENFLTLLMDYTEANWSNTQLKVEDFSRPVGCSKSQLYRKLSSLTGISPNSFIREYRLNEALALLHNSKGNVSEIAFETGFSSPSYFSKCFQKRYGHSPSDYLQSSKS
jgi:AraC-like DNA-binding protein